MSSNSEFETISRLWQEFRKSPFPARLLDGELAGEDMLLLDRYLAGCVSSWVGNGGGLDDAPRSGGCSGRMATIRSRRCSFGAVNYRLLTGPARRNGERPSHLGDVQRRSDFDVDPGSIVAWGVSTGADIYCWLTTDDDPDRWPVLVCGRHTSPAFQVHPFGMAEFLQRLLGDATFQEETISVTLPEEVSFVNRREQQRRRTARAGRRPAARLTVRPC